LWEDCIGNLILNVVASYSLSFCSSIISSNLLAYLKLGLIITGNKRLQTKNQGGALGGVVAIAGMFLIMTISLFLGTRHAT
jgi:hypothetical protein